MQSAISTNRFLSLSSMLRILPIIFDVLLIIDIFVSSYILFFSPDRTFGFGIWVILAYQLFFLPIFILIAYLNTRKFGLNQTNSITKNNDLKIKHPLAYSISNNETEIVVRPFERRLAFIKTLIYFGFALDLVVVLNFMVIGFLITDVGGDGSIAAFSLILDQVYFLPPVLMLIFYYFHLQGQQISSKESNIEILKGGIETSSTQKTFFSRLKIRKTMRLIIILSFIFLLLFFAVFAYAKQVEDNNINDIDLHDIGPYEKIEIHGMYDKGNKINVIASALLWRGRSLSYHILKYTADTENNKILSLQEVPNIPSGFRRVIDSVVTNKEIYLMLLDNQDWNYLVYKYTFETDLMELLYTWELKVTGNNYGGSKSIEYQVKFDQFVYFLSPYENGVHLIQTQIPFSLGPHSAKITTIDLNGITQQSLNFTILDVVTHNNNTYLIHISLSNLDHFDLTTYNGVGANFSDRPVTSKVLAATFSEKIYDVPTPNSATLFVLNNTLYYRSTQNLLNIDSMESSNQLPQIRNRNYDFFSRGLRGSTYQNDLLFLSTETQIQYMGLFNLKESENARAKNSHYSSSKFSNILISNDKLVTASDNGRIFTWDIKPQLITEDKDRFNELIRIGIIIYLSSSSIYFVVRRKI